MSKFDFECDGRDLLDKMFESMYPKSETLRIVAPSRCIRAENTVSDSVLTGIIQQKIENKAMPIAMRKRLLYEQALAS